MHTSSSRNPSPTNTTLAVSNSFRRLTIQNAFIIIGLIAVAIVTFRNYGWHWMSAIVYPTLIALLFSRITEVISLIQKDRVFSLSTKRNNVGAIWASIRITGVFLVLFGMAFDVEAFNRLFDDDIICRSLWYHKVPEVVTLAAFGIGLVLCVMPVTQFVSTTTPTSDPHPNKSIQIAVSTFLATIALALLLLKANYDAVGFTLVMSLSQQIQFGNFNINTEPFAYSNTTEAVTPLFRGSLLGIFAICIATVGILVAKKDLLIRRRVGIGIYLTGMAAAIFLLFRTPWQTSLPKISPLFGEFHIVPTLAPILSIAIASVLVSIPLAYWLNRESELVQLAPKVAPNENTNPPLLDNASLLGSELSWWISIPLLLLLVIESDLISEFIPLASSNTLTPFSLQEWFGDHSILHWLQFDYSLKLLALISFLWLLKGIWNRAQLKRTLDCSDGLLPDQAADNTGNASFSWRACCLKAIKNRFIFQHLLAIVFVTSSFAWWRVSQDASNDSQAQLRSLVMLLLAAMIWSWNRDHRVCTTHSMPIRRLAWTAAALTPILILSSYFFQWFGASSAWADDGRGSSSIFSSIYKIYSLFG